MDETTTQPESVTKAPPPPGSFVTFTPSDRFLKKYKVPKAHYVAVVIGTQKFTRQPILRVYNPYAGQVEKPKQPTLPKTVLKAHLGPFELNSEVGGPKIHDQDWTVWSDPEGTWGTWEPT